MDFYFINVETIGKYKNGKKNSHLKNIISPANDLLLHKCRNNEKMRKCMKKIEKINIQVQLIYILEVRN